MVNDEKRIRKLYGEDMWHLCRTLFPTILDTPGLLSSLLEKNFNPCRYLYQDIKKNGLEVDFKDYIYSFVNVETKRKKKTFDSVSELFDQAGYDFYECHSEKDIQSFRHYYRSDEELCTFLFGNRLNRCMVFFAVKKNVDEIKRENFKNPQREDEYGTSVLSLQFARGSKNTLSIKNRYNHTVNNPDATFHNNLELIIPGLTHAFEKEYNLKINQDTDSMFELDNFNYVYADFGKWYKYNFEANGIYYCPDNIIIDDYSVKKFPKEQFVIFDNFILDLVKKKMGTYDCNLSDSIPKECQKITKIDIHRQGSNKQLFITTENGYMEIIIDNKNRIISYKDNFSTSIQQYFLCFSDKIKHLELLNCEKIGSYFMESRELSKNLEELIIPKVKEIGDFCFLYSDLDIIDCSSLFQLGYKSLDLSFGKVSRHFAQNNFDKDGNVYGGKK